MNFTPSRPAPGQGTGGYTASWYDNHSVQFFLASCALIGYSSNQGGYTHLLKPFVPPPLRHEGFFISGIASSFLPRPKSDGIVMKNMIPSLLLVLFSAFSTFAGEYNADYCHDPAELKKWDHLLNSNPDSEPLVALHALWIGLCVKVEARQLTTLQANQIFDRFRDALVEQIKQQEGSDDRKRI